MGIPYFFCIIIIISSYSIVHFKSSNFELQDIFIFCFRIENIARISGKEISELLVDAETWSRSRFTEQREEETSNPIGFIWHTSTELDS